MAQGGQKLLAAASVATSPWGGVSTNKIRPIWLRQEDRSFWANWASTNMEEFNPLSPSMSKLQSCTLGIGFPRTMRDSVHRQWMIPVAGTVFLLYDP